MITESDTANRRSSRGLLAATFLTAVCVLAGPAAAEGDPERGERLAFTCLGCHGIDGYRNAYPSYRVPKLGGQRAEYIIDALTAYRDGGRPHPTMQAQGGSLTDQDIDDLAVWFEGAGEGGSVAQDSVTSSDIVGLEAATTCLQCHGEGGDIVMPKPPVLSGQHEDYLIHALLQYQGGARPGNVMTAFAATLTDDDIEQIAAFYAARDGLVTPEKSE